MYLRLPHRLRRCGFHGLGLDGCIVSVEVETGPLFEMEKIAVVKRPSSTLPFKVVTQGKSHCLVDT